MTAALVTLHVTPDAKSFATAGLSTLVRLLARVTVAVNSQAAGTRERLVTCRANVAVLRLGESGLAGCADVVMMLPWV